MSKGKKKEELTPREQKTTAAFKLLREQNEILKESLVKTQNELEGTKDKYHAADKDSAVLRGRNQTMALHEILKYLLGALGAVGVNLLTDGNYGYGFSALVGSVVLFTIVVWFDRR